MSGYIIWPIINLLLLLSLHKCLCNPIKSSRDAMAFLNRFGYFRQPTIYLTAGVGGAGRPVGTSAFSSAMRKYQRMVGLPSTGFLDRATLSMMNSPRCGNPDFENGSRTRVTRSIPSLKIRVKRYVLHGSKWPKTTMTYKILNYPRLTNMNPVQVRNMIARAFELWREGSRRSLRFIRKTSGSVDMDILFAARSHGDRFAFDGPGRTLAHAFFPRYGGDIHFDNDERWILSGRVSGSFMLLIVATHEIGHALGLKHSSTQGAIMFPNFVHKEPVRLSSDDISGIRKLYPKVTSSCRVVTVRVRVVRRCGWWWRRRNCTTYRNATRRVCT